MENNGKQERIERVVRLEPIQTLLAGCSVEITPLPSSGGKQLEFSHPSGEVWIVPLLPEACKAIGARLLSSLDVPRARVPEAGGE